jgi:hypothetical protein
MTNDPGHTAVYHPATAALVVVIALALGSLAGA